MGYLPYPVSSASFHIFGEEIRCHVLNTGERIIEEESVVRFLKALAEYDGPMEEMKGEVERFAQWRAGATIASSPSRA